MDAVAGSRSPKLSFNDFRPDPTKFVLILGSGVLAYEIFSRLFRKIIDQTVTSQSLINGTSLFFSAVFVIRACTLDLHELHINFGALCIGYMFLSLLSSREIDPLSTSSALPSFMIDMVAEAKEGKYAMVGHEAAVRNAEIVMNSSIKPNALLLAHPGVGKSTIPETIAYNIAKGLYPPGSLFAGARLIQIEIHSLLADTTWRGTLEKKIGEMLEMAKKDPKIIYFIDEIHLLVGAGITKDSNIDGAQLLQPALAGRQIRVLGATTPEDYYKIIAPRIAFERRFTLVRLGEPKTSECFTMLRHRYNESCKQGKFKVSDQAIAAAIFLSDLHCKNRYFPDKAVDPIEHALSKARLDHHNSTAEIIINIEHIAEAHLMYLSQGKDSMYNIEELKKMLDESAPSYLSIIPVAT